MLLLRFFFVIFFACLFYYIFFYSFQCPLPVSSVSDRVPGWTWFGSVYLMTTAGFVADQFMRDKQQQQLHLYIIDYLLFWFVLKGSMFLD